MGGLPKGERRSRFSFARELIGSALGPVLVCRVEGRGRWFVVSSLHGKSQMGVRHL